MKKLCCMLSLLCALQAEAQVPAYVPHASLMAWFPFTGNAIDSTYNGHDGTVNGCTMATGRFGVPNTAYRFNGINNYIFIPAGVFVKERSVDITASLTISAWVKSSNYFYNPQSQIYWRGDATPATDPHMLYFISGDVRIRRDVDPGSTVTEVGTSVTGLDTNFHMMTGTYDSVSGMLRIYLDGVEKYSSYSPGLQTYPTATMYNYIGAVDGGTWQFFYGVMDELGIWSRALSPCEIAAMYGAVPNIITAQPVSDSVSAGTTVTFHAGVTAPAAVYQWQVNAGTGYTNLTNTAPYSGVNTATLTITPAHYNMNGYRYRCMVSSGTCVNQMTDSATLTVSASIGVADIAANNNSLRIVPQPTSGQFVVTRDAVGAADVTLEITDVAGRVVYKETVTPAGGKLQKQVNLGNTLAEGIYILRLSSASINEKAQVVIKR